MTHSKRRTISLTSNLVWFNSKLIVANIIVFLVISIYPIVNFVITNDFLTEFRYKVNELSLVYYMKGNIAINYAANYLRASLNLHS
jgi:hypothetical protein